MAKWDGEWSGRGEAHAYEAGYDESRQRAEQAERLAEVRLMVISQYVGHHYGCSECFKVWPSVADYMTPEEVARGLAVDLQAVSRSVQRRKAAQGGEPTPEFGFETFAQFLERNHIDPVTYERRGEES